MPPDPLALFAGSRACVLTPTPGLESESSYCPTPTFFRARNTELWHNAEIHLFKDGRHLTKVKH